MYMYVCERNVDLGRLDIICKVNELLYKVHKANICFG
jgi:hypothetical protein